MNLKSDNIRILVVDDEGEILAFLRKMLEKKGYYVEIALDGAEAIHIARRQIFDIVVTDLNMPKMYG